MVSLIQIGDFITDLGLLIALVLFVFLLFRSRVEGSRLKSFKFWVSIVVIFWVIPEAITLRGPFSVAFQTDSVTPEGLPFERLETSPGPWIHTVSMVTLSALIFWKLRFLLGL